jgi:hypothetical protein
MIFASLNHYKKGVVRENISILLLLGSRRNNDWFALEILLCIIGLHIPQSGDSFMPFLLINRDCCAIAFLLLLLNE